MVCGTVSQLKELVSVKQYNGMKQLDKIDNVGIQLIVVVSLITMIGIGVQYGHWSLIVIGSYLIGKFN